MLGHLMIDVAGVTLTPEERERLRHPLVAGVILFTRNFVDRAQLHELVREIRALRAPPLLLAVDHEGGRVQRFRSEFTALPASGDLGRLYEVFPRRALTLAQESGWLMASELRAGDIDFSFAPVLDVDSGISAVIGNRAFHAQPEVIHPLAGACVRGMHEAGMIAVGKHFPGHGSVIADSHLAVSVDMRPFAEIAAHDLRPFAELVALGLDAVMPAHVIYSQVDTAPAGFSPVWLQTHLRQGLKFNGAIISDDICMAGTAVVGDYPQRAYAAQTAGCDLILICNDPPAADAVLDSRMIKLLPPSQQRVEKLRGQAGAVNINVLQAGTRWHNAQKLLAELAAQAPPAVA